MSITSPSETRSTSWELEPEKPSLALFYLALVKGPVVFHGDRLSDGEWAGETAHTDSSNCVKCHTYTTMFHSTSDGESEMVSRPVVEWGADAYSTSFYALDKKPVHVSVKMYHKLSSDLGAKTSERSFGPAYVKAPAADDSEVAAGITNSDHCSSHYYPENVARTKDIVRTFVTEKDP